MGVIREFPRHVDVLASLHDAATVAVEAAHLLGTLLGEPETASLTLQRLRTLEHQGDAIIHAVHAEINRRAATASPREDLRVLAYALADLIDGIAVTGQRAARYRLPVTASAQHLVGVLQTQTEIVAATVPLLADKGQHAALRGAVVELHRLANEADHTLIHVLSGLYAGVTEIPAFVQAWRWEELAVLLEETTDRAEKIGHAMLRVMGARS
jgi:uncharacterized protein Yka (UPF0111/DUF47 family)